MSSYRRIAAVAVGAALVCASTVGVAWASWSTHSTIGGHGAGAATSVNRGSTPTAVAAGADVSLDWPASTLSTGDAVTGYRVARYDAQNSSPETVLAGCAGTRTLRTCTESGLPDGRWVYTITPVIGTHWSGPEGPPSAPVTTDSTAPANALTSTALSGNALQSGTTIYYRGTAAGSFTLTNAVTDALSGPASSATAALTGTTAGWTHVPSTVSSPDAGPFVSNGFSWSAGTTGSATEVVTGRDVAGNARTTTLSFVDDSTGPTGGTISFPDGYQTDPSVTVTFGAGTDNGSGVASGTLQRAVASLTSGSCGTFSGYTDLGSSSPTSPVIDAGVAEGYCYSYRYVETDRLGNQGITTTAAVAKIDPYAGGPNLGAASTYSVLAGTGVSNTGPTIVTGDLGVTQSGVVTGFPPGVITGSDDEGNAAAAAAQTARTSAYDDAAARPVTATFAGDQIGQTFHAGVYRTTSAFTLSGTMTLDAQGDPNAVFVFQVDGALTTAASTAIALVNGAQAAHVYWQVTDAVSLGELSTFAGTILADGAITLGQGATLGGRALSPAFVTLADNAIMFATG